VYVDLFAMALQWSTEISTWDRTAHNDLSILHSISGQNWFSKRKDVEGFNGGGKGNNQVGGEKVWAIRKNRGWIEVPVRPAQETDG